MNRPRQVERKMNAFGGPCAVRLIDKVMIVLYHFQSLAHYYHSFC